MDESIRIQGEADRHGVHHAGTGRPGPSKRAAPRGAAQAQPGWSKAEWRMVMLLGMIALVSLADLWLTLTYLKNGGMSEGNPVARWVIAMNCAWVLAVFKIVLVGFTVSVLWWARKRRIAEVAAWFGCLVMAWLCFRWDGYTRHVADVVSAEPEITQTTIWVQID